MAAICSPTGKPLVLPPLHPNVGIEMDYRRRLQRLVRQMHDSLTYWILATYRNNEPEMLAADESPAAALRRTIRRLAQRWQSRFDDLAPQMAKYFATAATKRADGALAAMLRKGGISVKFTMTPKANDVFRASINEQVSLIKSIASEHLTKVEGMVMRSVQAGRDVGGLTKDLEAAFGVTHRRAAFIAKDQNNKATAVIQRVRQQELGITEAVWMHSGGGNHPRPTHVANSGKPYDVAKGWWDPAIQKRIWPGTEINCRCVSGSIVPGYNG